MLVSRPNRRSTATTTLGVAGLLALAVLFPQVASAFPDRVLYQQDQRLWITDTNGGTGRQVTTTSVTASALAPDGERAVGTDGGGGVWVFNLATGGSSKIVASVNPVGRPKFSSDGKKVIFEMADDIYTVNSDGTALTRVIGWKGIQRSADFSPDGRQIVFDSDSTSTKALTNNSPQVFVANADGSNSRQLTSTTTTAYGLSPVFDPSGTRIAYEKQDPGARPQIAVMNVDGTGKTVLTNAGANFNPAWSPDGTSILFTSDRNWAGYGLTDIYMVDASGGNDRLFLPRQYGGPNFVSPSWRRVSSTYSQYDYLAAEMRPALYFDGSETWRPLDVNKFFAESPSHSVCNNGVCTPVSSPSQLSPYPSTAYLDIQGSGSESNYHSPTLGTDCPASQSAGLRDCDAGPKSASYYHVSGSSPRGYRYLDFWFFYRYNYFGSGRLRTTSTTRETGKE